jgi:hypothetical protein
MKFPGKDGRNSHSRRLKVTSFTCIEICVMYVSFRKAEILDCMILIQSTQFDYESISIIANVSPDNRKRKLIIKETSEKQ